MSTTKTGIKPEIGRCLTAMANLSYDEAKRQAIALDESVSHHRPRPIPPIESVNTVQPKDDIHELSMLVKESLRVNQETSDALHQRISQLETQIGQMKNNNSIKNSPKFCNKCNKKGNLHFECKAKFCTYCRKPYHLRENCWLMNPRSRQYDNETNVKRPLN